MEETTKETQPPITTTPDEYAGYPQALADINVECAGREQDVFQARNNPARLERARVSLFCMYRIRQGTRDALADYERQHPTSRRKSG